MKLARTLAALGGSLIVAACVAGPPPGPAVIVVPGKDKNEAAFQQDDSVCRQHAIAHTGFGEGSQQPAATAPLAPTPPPAGAGTNNAAVPAGATSLDELSYMQCMAARGDIVQMTSMDGYNAGYAAAYPYSPAYPYPYGYGYPDGYPFEYPYYAGIVGGWGWWHGRSWGRGGWHHGGWGHTGFHGGHGGGGHGGGGHGGGGHH